MAPAHSHRIPCYRVGVWLNMLNTLSGVVLREAAFLNLHPPQFQTPLLRVKEACLLFRPERVCRGTARQTGLWGLMRLGCDDASFLMHLSSKQLRGERRQ